MEYPPPLNNRHVRVKYLIQGRPHHDPPFLIDSHLRITVNIISLTPRRREDKSLETQNGKVALQKGSTITRIGWRNHYFNNRRHDYSVKFKKPLRPKLRLNSRKNSINFRTFVISVFNSRILWHFHNLKQASTPWSSPSEKCIRNIIII